MWALRGRWPGVPGSRRPLRVLGRRDRSGCRHRSKGAGCLAGGYAGSGKNVGCRCGAGGTVGQGMGSGAVPMPSPPSCARAVEIATILSASGFGWLVQALDLGVWVSLRCRLVCALRPGTQCPHHLAVDVPLPERLRLTLERLGPTFVKAGQMLALRPDYIPLEYAEALRGLHTHAAPFPAAEAAAIVEAETGRTTRSTVCRVRTGAVRRGVAGAGAPGAAARWPLRGGEGAASRDHGTDRA